MRRFIIFAAMAAMAAMALTACQQNLNIEEEKPEGTVVFTASTELPSTKTALDASLNVVWQDEDIILIVDGDNRVGQFQTSSGGATTATFTHYGDFPVTQSPFIAWYPTSLMVGSKFTLPSIQNYVADNIAGNPMYAESSNTSLSFKNLCGIIRLNISTTLSGKKVKKIILSADQGMSGAITNVETLAADNFVAEVSGTASITLDCGESGVEIGTIARPFYIAIPGNNYTGLEITVETTDGLSQTRSLKSDKSILVGRSKITDISLAFNDYLLVIDLTESDDEVTIPAGVNAKLIGSNQYRDVIIEGSGSTVYLENATMRMMTINGDATIEQTGTNTINDPDYQNPIDIKEGSTVTFRGDGTLNLNASYCTGALVCENNNADIIIESGTYNLVAGTGCSSTISAGGLTISGGTVMASTSQIGIYAEKDVLISGGAVIATGNSQGIYVNGGDLLITGGTVIAEQTQNSTFWGGPEALVAGIVVNTKDGAGVEGGNLTISGGTVNAIGHIGPGIGSSWHRSGWSYPSWTKSIVISGGTVTASTEQSGFGAIFYSGAFATTGCDKITITEGITKLTLIQGATAEKMFGSGDISATFTVDGKNMTGYLTDPSSADWTFDHLQRTISTTTNDNDTWTFTPKP